ncbi:hypothetical protein CANARDRAFT_28766 [[Candida] arabinofermentans NRRL YB-2248]|uniref:FAD dependent oxidoreductase domain-containing protein n=1 Tax=[Candida] arabinofermentans NRRL YB-2248 TaxID=983967 RepID=A0A1E4SZV7_9ASCO|nr:hypothetical protein CANARDRAFT_28766 [[Candida] arabinofermentans NRRL YB-2248]
MSKYVIIGSGIVGLYTAQNLLDKDVDPLEITVYAEYLPGDQSINYTSPWAGGNFSCISPDDAQTLQFDKFTYTNLARLRSVLGGDGCGLDNRPTTEFWDFAPDETKISSLSSYLKDYQVLDKSELPDGAVFGIKYTTWNFNCPEFLANFKTHLETKGVRFVRKKLSHVKEAFVDPTTTTVFNCTGIGAKFLKGVEDDKIYPARGQVVVIKAPHINENRLRWGTKDVTYIIPRPDSKNQVILGGYLQAGNWCADTWEYETKDILKRTIALYPELAHNLEIIRVACGLRPSRKGGVRVEKEQYSDGKYIVHISGLSGYGYQAGFGASNLGVQLSLRDSKL